MSTFIKNSGLKLKTENLKERMRNKKGKFKKVSFVIQVSFFLQIFNMSFKFAILFFLTLNFIFNNFFKFKICIFFS